MFSKIWSRSFAVGGLAAVLIGLIAFGVRPASAQNNELSEFDVVMGLAATMFLTEPDLDNLLLDNAMLETLYDTVTPGEYNPFRGEEVTFDDGIVDTATIDGFWGAEINTSSEEIGWEADLSANLLLFGTDRTEVVDHPERFPPVSGDGAIDIMAEIERLYDGVGPDDLVSLAPIRVDPNDFVFMIGARTEGRSDLTCTGVRHEFGVFFDTSLTNWDDSTGADSEAFNDFFFNGDTAFVNRCIDGEWATIKSEFSGPGGGFVETEGPFSTIVGPYGWLTFIPLSEVPDPSGFRVFEFVTDSANPYTPQTTAASAHPADLTELFAMPELQAVAYDPALDTPVAADSTTSSTSSSTTSTSEASPSTTQGTEPVEEPDDGGLPWGPIVVGLGIAAVVVGVGITFLSNRSES